MKKTGVIISVLLNVFLLGGLIFLHQYDVKNCKKEETVQPSSSTTEKKSMVVECIKDGDSTGSTDVFKELNQKVLIEHNEEGTLTSLKSGVTYEVYKDEDYESIKSANEHYEELGDRKIFIYVEDSVKAKTESGEERDVWYMSTVNTYKNDGYTCK